MWSKSLMNLEMNSYLRWVGDALNVLEIVIEEERLVVDDLSFDTSVQFVDLLS